MLTKENKPKGSVSLPTDLPGLIVHINWHAIESGKIKLSGYAILEGVRLDGKSYATAANRDELEVVINQLKNLIIKKTEKIVKKTRVKNAIADRRIDDNEFTKAYDAVNHPEDYLAEGWSEGTAKAALTWFARHILPELCNDDNKLDVGNLISVIDKSVKNNAKTLIGNITFNRDLHLRNSQRIYNHMRSFDPLLPEIMFLDGISADNRKNVEQQKYLPVNMLKNICTEVEQMMESNPKLARSMITMISGGLRTAEAAAIISANVRDLGFAIVIDVKTQEKQGRRVGHLKTRYSYRSVVLDPWGSVQMRSVSSLIVDVDEDEDIAPVLADDIRQWFSSVISSLGITAKEIAGWRSEMYLDAQFNDDDITAYILRRTRATIWEHFCGYSKDEIDRQLGHKLKSRSNIDWKAMDTFRVLSRKLERFDNEVHIDIDKAGIYDINSYHNIQIENCGEEAVTLVINVESREPGRSITMHTDGTIAAIKGQSIEKKTRARKPVELLGIIYKEEE